MVVKSADEESEGLQGRVDNIDVLNFVIAIETSDWIYWAVGKEYGTVWIERALELWVISSGSSVQVVLNIVGFDEAYQGEAGERESKKDLNLL